MKLENHHSASYFRLNEDMGGNATAKRGKPSIPLTDWCQSALYPQQARYFLWKVEQFDFRGPFAGELNDSLAALLYELVFRMAAETGQVENCNVVSAGAGMEGGVDQLVRVTETLEPLHCTILAYELTREVLAETKEALVKFPSAKVRLSGFADIKAQLGQAGARYTTLDHEIQSHVGRGFDPKDALIVRLDKQIVGELLTTAESGTPEMRAFKGLEKSLMARRVTALVWTRTTARELRIEVDHIAAFGYRVYFLGRDKMLRVDGKYWDPTFSGEKAPNEVSTATEDSLFTESCNVTVTLVALVNGHSFHEHAMKELQVCVPKDGGACICDTPPATEPLGSCKPQEAALAALEGGVGGALGPGAGGKKKKSRG
mmetsp:Transcript_64635/g.204043  ORF Transcript_64635/g.204043 Transcript_64635/m.204043 type:complete len:373 (-) Transcript_64635:321-1439(-)